MVFPITNSHTHNPYCSYSYSIIIQWLRPHSRYYPRIIPLWDPTVFPSIPWSLDRCTTPDAIRTPEDTSRSRLEFLREGEGILVKSQTKCIKTVAGCEILHQLVFGLSHYFWMVSIHPRSFRISSIHSMNKILTHIIFQHGMIGIFISIDTSVE